MDWRYYLVTIIVILSGVVFCAVLLSKYMKIKRYGSAVSCEITDCYIPHTARMAKEIILDVTYELDGETHNASCKMRRFSYYAPKVGEIITFIHVPGVDDTLYPTKINRYPIFTTAVMMAAMAVMFAAGLISAIISLSAG